MTRQRRADETQAQAIREQMTRTEAEAGQPLDYTLAEELARRAATAADNARLYAEAQAAIRSRDEFLSVAAHELRTPLTALRGVAQLALRQLNRSGTLGPERERQVLEQINEQTATLSNLVNQLLDIARLDGGTLALERSPVDIMAVVASAVRAVRARATAQEITVTIQGLGELPAFLDATRIGQVLMNLLDQAITFSPHRGVIDINVTLPLPNTVGIAVRDHGSGLPPEEQAHIFDRFYQAHRGDGYSSLGLGLAISRQITELHGGALDVDAPLGGGTRFSLLLPLSGEDDRGEDAADPRVTNVTAGGRLPKTGTSEGPYVDART